MKINKYTKNERQLAQAAAVSGGSSSSTTIQGGGSASLDRTIWGQNDTGDDVDGSMTVNGNIHIKVIEPLPDEDDDEDEGTGDYEEYEEGGGNLEVDEKTTTKELEVGEDAYIKRHLYLHYPSHPEHPEGNKKCVGEIFKSIEDSIATEKARAEGKEKELSDAIATEKTRAEKAEKDLSDAIDAEKKRAMDAEDVLDTNVQMCETGIRNNAEEIVKLQARTTQNETAIASLLPIGSIIMYNGLAADIPEGWHICDGTDGTPNLIDRFIKASNTAGATGGANSVTLQSWNIPKMQLNKNVTRIESDKEWKERLNKKIVTLDRVGERVVDKGGSTHWCLDTGTNEGDHGLLGVNYTTVFDDVADYTYIGSDSPSAISTEPSYFALIFIMKLA